MRTNQDLLRPLVHRNRDAERNERHKQAVADARKRNGVGKARSPRYPVYLVLCVDLDGEHYWRILCNPPGKVPIPHVVSVRGPEMLPASKDRDEELNAARRLAGQGPAVTLSCYPHTWEPAESPCPA